MPLDYILWGISACFLLYVYYLIALEIGPNIAATDQHLHSKIKSSFPTFLNIVDRLSQWILDGITDNKFGYVLTLVLVVLTIVGLVSASITLATIAIWWILLFWAIRSEAMSELTIPTRLVALILLALLLAGGCLKFRNWSLKQYVASLATPHKETSPLASSGLTPDNIEQNVRAWASNAGFTVKQQVDPDFQFFLSIPLRGGIVVSVAVSKQWPKHIEFQSPLVIPWDVAATLAKMSKDERLRIKAAIIHEIASTGVGYDFQPRTPVSMILISSRRAYCLK